MEMNIPRKLDDFSHGGIVKALLAANTGFEIPSRTEWMNHVPDLVHKEKKMVVEVEMSDLEKGWGQCLSYYRLGSNNIHLVLPPTLYSKFLRDEMKFTIKNPIPNITVYELPSIPKKSRGRPRETYTTRQVTLKDPMEKFYGGEGRPIINTEHQVDGKKGLGVKIKSAPLRSEKRGGWGPSIRNKLKTVNYVDDEISVLVTCNYCDKLVPSTITCLYCGGQLHPLGWYARALG